MTLNDNDKEWVRLVAKEMMREVLEAADSMCSKRVEKHVALCPHVQKLKWLLIGAGIVIGASGQAIFDRLIGIFGR